MLGVGISNVISLFSGIALFLFGMALMGDGLKQVAGNKLELILYRLTGSPVKGFLLGTGVTAVIQSSSATSVMVVGFVNSGMMKVRQSISIVLGAILGTSITGWIICLSDIGSTGGWMDLFSTATLTGVISVIGIVLRMASKDPAKKHIGDILMGFAVLMFGMSTMSAAVSPLRDDPTFIRILTSFSNPFLGILFGTLFTCVLQSASAAVGILQALASTGIIDFSIALPIIMGIAIGAAMPVLLSAIGASVDGKRTAMVYLVAEVTGVILFAAIYYTLDALIRFPFADRIMTSVSIAFVNTVFRFIKVVALLPFTQQIEKAVNLLVRDKPQQKTVEPEAMRLEERFIQHPALAIEQSRLTINAMAEEAKRNFVEAVALLHGYSDERFRLVENLETSVDRYEDKLGTYLVKVTEREMTAKQNAEVSKFLHTISDFERISDHALNIAEGARELHQKNLSFSDAAAGNGLCLGSIVALVFTFLYYWLRGLIKFEKSMESIPNGFIQMISPILILCFAWTLCGLCRDDGLQVGEFVKGVMAGTGSLAKFLPAVIFIVACFIGFATGTSWGTIGIMVPLVCAVFDWNSQVTLLSIGLAASCAGGVCGDHLSPISDTTIMASAGAHCYHLNHVSTQIPYGVTVAAVSFVSFIIAGLVQNVVICMIIAIALMIVTLFVIKAVVAKKHAAVIAEIAAANKAHYAAK